MYAGGLDLRYLEKEKECPICGYVERQFGLCCSSTVTVVNRRSSRGEIKCYQKLYGDLVTYVDHYKYDWEKPQEQQ
jgi:signal peptidase I